MSALPPPLPPATPIRKTVIPDPFSATSTLTPLSSVGDSWTKSSSPSALSRPRTSSPEDGDGSPPPPRRISQRPKRSTRFDALLTPQKALPARMKLVSDPNVATGKAAALERNNLRRKRKRRATSDDEGSELDVWRREDFDLSDEWSEEEYEDLMLCLREDGLLKCMDKYLVQDRIPVRKMLKAFGKEVDHPEATEEYMVARLQSVMRQALRNRTRLENYNTPRDVANLIWRAKRIIVLTGAGISVSSGVPDFRSPDGIYAKIKASGQYEDLDDPQQMFSIEQFKKRPDMFYSFIGQLWPQEVNPSVAHQFLKLLEDQNKLLRNYTQNIDGLETACGVENVFHCHGSFQTATCMDCGTKVPGSQIQGKLLKGQVPQCDPCVAKAEEMKANVQQQPKRPTKKSGKNKRSSKPWEEEESDELTQKDVWAGVIKPDITFFGEQLADDFDNLLYQDREEVDLLIVIGTSLKVKPVSEILAHIPHTIPQILINKTPVEHANPDVVLLGDCDEIVRYLCHELEWVLPSQLGEDRGQGRRKRKGSSEELTCEYPKRLGQSHVWTFDGARVPTGWARKYDANYVRDRKMKRARTGANASEGRVGACP